MRAVRHASLQEWLRGLGWMLASILICSGVGLLFERHLEPAVVAMIYLAGVIATASRIRVGAAAVSAAVHALVYDYVFLPPRFGFAVPDIKGWITLLVMMLVGAVLASSHRQSREQERLARLRADMASSMYLLLRELCVASSAEQVGLITSRNVERMVRGRAVVVNATPSGPDEASAFMDEQDRHALRDAWSSLEPVVRRGSGGMTTFCHPMLVMQRVQRVLFVKTKAEPSFTNEEVFQLLEHAAQLGTMALERVSLEREAHRAQLAVETEQMRSTLLSAVSHDVRTPLTSIKTAAEVLTGRTASLAAQEVGELASVIVSEADSLIRLVNNILNLTRFETGSLSLKRSEADVEELVSKAIDRVKHQALERPIHLDLPSDLPLVSVDSSLMEQVFANVLDNAIQYTPPSSPIWISATSDGLAVVVKVDDSGPGFHDDEETRVLEKFVRGSASGRRSGGLGLGLSICRAIMLAHGGAIRLGNREGGGASVTLQLRAGRKARIDER
jgi:two-component system sensor histidine kinase KdpD